MKSKTLTALSILGALVFWAASASALDAYQDRRGIFVGVGVGGGTGATNVESPGDVTGMENGRLLGLHLQGAVGGGVGTRLTFQAEGNWWIRTVQLGNRHLNHQHLSFLPVGNLFLFEGIYVLGGAGLAYAVFDAERAGIQVQKYREMGLAAKAGAGFEFFLNGTVAAGVEAAYTRHFYGNANFDTINGAITVRWY